MLRSGVKKEEKHGNSAAFLIGVRTKRNLRNLRRVSEKTRIQGVKWRSKFHNPSYHVK